MMSLRSRDYGTGQHARAGNRRLGFTLLELLVVIGIILLLMGILFPALTAAKETARKTKARADVRQLDIAFKAVIADYRGLGPFSSGNQKITAGTVGLLSGGNDKGIIYMEFDQSSTNSAGFADPWCNRKNPSTTPDSLYWVALDVAGSGVTPAGAAGSLPRQVAAWSAGPDKQSGTSDDVRSWQ